MTSRFSPLAHERQGDRLEVRWVITDDEDEDTVVWWPCTLRAIVPSGPSASWELHYDANEAHGFAAEVRPATFTNSRWVHDPGEGQHLRWRREGSTEDDVDDDDDAGDADDPNIVYAAEIDPDEGDPETDAVDHQHREGEEDLAPKFGDPEDVEKGLKHRVFCRLEWPGCVVRRRMFLTRR